MVLWWAVPDGGGAVMDAGTSVMVMPPAGVVSGPRTRTATEAATPSASSTVMR